MRPPHCSRERAIASFRGKLSRPGRRRPRAVADGAGIGNDVKVAAINASDELHKVKIPAINIMATTDKIGLDAKGKIIR